MKQAYALSLVTILKRSALRYRPHLSFLAIACLISSSPVQAIPLTEQVSAVASHLIGIMDTTAQAAANPEAPSVRMTTCQVQLDNQSSSTASIFLYQEQALTKRLTQPYRQRLLELTPHSKTQTVESKSYKLQNQESFIGFCDQPIAQRIIPATILEESFCSVFLAPLNDIYFGRTQPGGCPANVRGAVTITNKIVLHEQGMDTWDRGFDENGEQVWGAIDSSYQFRWLVQREQSKSLSFP